MNFRLYFFFLFPFVVYAKLIDFGVCGSLYDIAETNGDDFIQKKINDINTTQVKKELLGNIDKLAYSKMTLQKSYKDTSTTYKDTIVVQTDIKDVYGNIIYKKGDRVVSKIPNWYKLELCFVDASLNDDVIDEIINEFGKKCIYFVANRNYESFSKKFNVESYPMGGQNIIFAKRFHVQMYPSKIVKQGSFFTIQTLNVKRLTIKASRY